MNSIIAIPARATSERIKEKPLINILGKPAIQWVVETALKNKRNSKVIVCSDSQKVLDIVKESKIVCNLSKQRYQNGTDRVFEYSLGMKDQPSSIVVFDCGEIMIHPETLDKLTDLIISGSFDIVTCVQEISGFDMADSNTVKASLSSNNEILYLSRAPIPLPINQGKASGIKFWKHIGVTGYSLKAAKELLYSDRCDAENIEEIDLLRALNCHLKIGTINIDYKRTCLNTKQSLSEIESSISLGRIQSGKSSKIINF